MKYISDAVPSLPFYYYHIPSLDSITFTMQDFITASQSPSINFTNLVGIKYTGLYNNPSFADITSILHKFSNIEILTGRDEMLVQGSIISARIKMNVILVVHGSYNDIMCIHRIILYEITTKIIIIITSKIEMCVNKSTGKKEKNEIKREEIMHIWKKQIHYQRNKNKLNKIGSKTIKTHNKFNMASGHANKHCFGIGTYFGNFEQTF